MTETISTALSVAEKFVTEYEWDDGESGHYVPTEFEQAMMLDMVNGLFTDDGFLTAILASRTHPEPVNEPAEGEVEKVARAIHWEQYEDPAQAEHEWNHWAGSADYARKLARSALRAASIPKVEPPDGFSVTLKPTRTGFKHPHDEGKMLRIWIGQTNRGQSMSMLSYGFYCSGSFEGMDYTPVDASELAEVPRDISERIDAVNVLAAPRMRSP